MTTRTCIMAISSLAAAACFPAADMEVNDSLVFLRLNGDASGAANRVVAATLPLDEEYPQGVPRPMFWFDASATQNWTVAGGAVTKIPSLTGERYLYLGAFPESWTNCTGHSSFPSPSAPRLATGVAALNGGACLDFGAQGSRRLLLFDPADGTNVLRNIGSIVAVWGSDANGGSLLGGGRDYRDNGAGSLFNGHLWSRGEDTYTASVTARYRSYMNPLLNNNDYLQLRNGVFRLDGMISSGYNIGFNGAWEVVSVRPAAANMCAAGIGLNDWRVPAVSGGQKVAEMMIFDSVLSHEDLARIERHLELKWFGRKGRSRGGNSYMKSARVFQSASSILGVTQEVSVASGRLTIGSLRGGFGRYGSPIMKTGEGELEVQDMKNYSSPVLLKSGTLAFGRRAVPAEPPERAYLWFDASAENALETENAGGTNFVVRWASRLAPVFYGNPITSARPVDAVDRPWKVADALGEGLHLVDFGPARQNGVCYMRFSTNDSASVTGQSVAQPGVVTILALVGAQNGGGVLVGGDDGRNHFRRQAAFANSHSNGLVCDNEAQSVIRSDSATRVSSNAVVLVDGLVTSGAEGYPTPEFHVLAYKAPGNASAIARIGGYRDVGMSANMAGGMMLGELLIYRRQLSEQELRDGSAYLMKKWLGRVAPGYSDGPPSVPDVQKVIASDGTSVCVEGDAEVRMGTLSLEDGATVTKKGSGTLELQSAELGSGRLEIESGAVKIVSGPSVAAASQIAAEPSLHLDATSFARMQTVQVADETRVLRWYDENFANSAYVSDSRYAPSVLADGLNGLPVLDFHRYYDYYGTSDGWQGGRTMALSRSLDSVKGVFIVWMQNEDSNTSIFLGASNSVNDNTGTGQWGIYRTGKAIMAYHSLNYHAMFGSALTNGVSVSTTSQINPGVWTLTEIYPNGGVHTSEICGYNMSTRFHGGARIAEIILYERELSAREKASTRNYLMQKWFGREPQPLPDEPAPGAIGGDVALADGYEWNVDAAPSGLCGGGLSVSGGLSIGSGVKVRMTGLAAQLAAGTRRFKLAEAASVDGLPDVDGLSTDAEPLRLQPRFAVYAGSVYLEFAVGFTMLFR